MMDKNKAGSGVQGNEDPIRSNRNYLQLKSYEQMGFCMFLPSHTYEKIQSHNPKLRGYLPGNGYISHPWEEENHLQQCLGMGYVSS